MISLTELDPETIEQRFVSLLAMLNRGMSRFLNTLLTLTTLLLATLSFSQIVFTETFDEGDGATSGNDETGNVSWTADCPTCQSGDHLEIVNGALENQDSNGHATWSSGVITTGCSLNEICFDLSFQGDFEDCSGGELATDFVALSYSIDGGAWQDPPGSFNCSGGFPALNVIWDGGNSTAPFQYCSGAFFGGNTLEIKITTQTWAGNEFIQIDNITVNCSCLQPNLIITNPDPVCIPNTVDITDPSITTGSDPGTLTYWEDNAGTIPLVNPTNISTSGTYYIQLDNGGCIYRQPVDVVINELPIPEAGNDLISCENSPITIGGSPVLNEDGATYTWDNGGGSGTIDIAGGSDGTTTVSPSSTTTYTVTVIDNNGCQGSDDMIVTVTPLDDPLFNPVADYCQNDIASPLPTSSNNGIDGSWSPAINTSTSGITTYTFTPNAGICANTTTLDINVNPTYNQTVNVVVCENDDYTFPDGSTQTITGNTSQQSILVTINACDSIITTNITMEASTSTVINNTVCYDETYTYADGAVSHNIVIDESHTSNLTSANGCDSTVIENITVLQNSQSTVDIEACENQSYTFPDGSTQIVTSDLTQNSTIVASNGCDSVVITNITMVQSFTTNENIEVCENETVFYPDGSSETITSSTTHNSILVSNNGCDSTVVTNVTMHPNYNVIEDVDLCEGDSFTYPDGASVNNITQSESHTSNFTSINGCDSIIITNLNVSPIPVINVPLFVNTCEGEEITLTATGAQNISWDNGIINGESFIPVGSQNYTVTGTNAAGCSNSEIVSVNVQQPPVIDVTIDNPLGCTPHEVILHNNVDGTTTTIWELSNGLTLTGNTVANTFTQGGIYDIEVTAVSEFGCVSTTSFIEAIEIISSPFAQFETNQSLYTSIDNQVTFTNNSTNATEYLWIFYDGTTSTQSAPIFELPEEGIGNYSTILIAYNDFGCTDTMRLSIPMEQELIFFIPNTFTPDGDEFNQSLKPVFYSGLDVYDFEFKIFNRWGELLFVTNNPFIGWDGTYGNYNVQEGTYIWTLEFRSINNDAHLQYNGHINVLK